MGLSLNDISPKGKLLIVLLLLSAVSIILTYLTGGLFLSIISAFISAFLFFVSKSIWLPEDHGKTLIRKISLGLVIIITGSYFSWGPIISKVLSPVLNRYFPNFTISQNAPSVAILIFSFAVIFIVNYLMRDNTAMKLHELPIDKEFPEKDFKTRLVQYSKILMNELNNIDIETNWNDFYFTPIESEVEVITDTKRRRKITDFMTAIKQDRKSQVFLVLGDPGSGKSIALRKLAKDLISEVKLTGKIPIYINLKEWQVEKKWSVDNPPTVGHLYDFIIKNLNERGDVLANEFLASYFKKMYEYGRIFFIIDSFDEIPEVMDVDESSWLIDELSDVIYKFLAGAHESRGILSSRVFRRPTMKFKTKTVFEIRPFTELKIEQTFSKNLSNINSDIFKRMFVERPELIGIARNPFMANLMIRYLKENNYVFPKNQSELYQSYINNRLESCKKKMENKDISKSFFLQTATKMSYLLFSSDEYGLEIPVPNLKKELNELSPEITDSFIDILVYSKIGRLSPIERRVSFVHRRFNEYFVVKHLMDKPELVSLENIPTDSRWRDALVLYCEVADNDRKDEISKYCWSEVIKLGEKDLGLDAKEVERYIHCLRFLTEAFKTSTNFEIEFKNDLADLIIKILGSDKSLLIKKYSIEASGLVSEEKLEEIVQIALHTRNTWLCETAFKASRHLGKIHANTKNRLIQFIFSIDSQLFFSKRNDFIFSASLSNSFNSIKKALVVKKWDFYLLYIGLALLFLLEPLAALSWFLLFSIPSINNAAKIGLTKFPLSTIFRISPIVTSVFYFFKLKQQANSKGFTSTFFYNLYGSEETWHFLYLIPAALILPYFFLIYFKNLVGFNIKRSLVISYTIGGVCFGALVLFVISPIIDSLAKKQWFIFVKNYIFIPLLVIGGCIVLFSHFKDWFLFKKKINEIKKVNVVSRETIAMGYSGIYYGYNRLLYIKAIKNLKIVPSGNWPDGKIPGRNNEESEILLNKLEEEWLGLIR